MHTATIKLKYIVPVGIKSAKLKRDRKEMKVERSELGIKYPLCDPPCVAVSHL